MKYVETLLLNKKIGEFMKKIILLLSLIISITLLYLVFEEIKKIPCDEFEHYSDSFKSFELTSHSDIILSKNTTASYYDGKNAKKCIKDVYGHLYPFINKKTVEKQSEKFLLGYNDNTFALSDGIGNLKEKSFALYGYRNKFSIEKCKENAEVFLDENKISYYSLKESRHFWGIHYFIYENSDGGIVTVGVDTEFCEIKYLNQ